MLERMLAGESYIPTTRSLVSNQRAMTSIETFNRSPASEPAARRRLLVQLLGAYGEGPEIRPPLYCDYGCQTSVGARPLPTSAWPSSTSRGSASAMTSRLVRICTAGESPTSATMDFAASRLASIVGLSASRPHRMAVNGMPFSAT